MFYEHQLQQYWLQYSIFLEGLTTNNGDPLRVIHPGFLNLNQGPDFLNAKIKIGDVIWVGKIEVHIYTSDWIKHFHQKDCNYKTIILHVVWKNDLPEFDISPVLELSRFLDNNYFLQQPLSSQLTVLHCSGKGFTRFEVSKHQELISLGLKRMNERKNKVLQLLIQNKNDFSASLWHIVFRAFGRSSNADFFESLFNSIPIHYFRLYVFDSRKIEALLFGQAGLLNDQFEDDYPRLLSQEYLLLKSRHNLKPVLEKVKFLRMRPRNFPTIRIAQLSAFFLKNIALVKVLLTVDEIEEVFQLFEVDYHRYWDNHFLFDRLSVEQFKEIGFDLKQQIILNAFIPFLLAYGEYNGQDKQVKKAMNWMMKLKPEKNAIISEFSKIGFTSSSMIDTQSLLELYTTMCIYKHCGECIRGKLLAI